MFLINFPVWFLASYISFFQSNDQRVRASPPPNVVVVLTDDQGYGDLACHGNPWIKTPNLDKLHARSVRFTDFHSGTTCAPTRASLMTGQYNNKVGVWHTIIGREYLRAGVPTMADLFKANGYTTAIFGKWHLGDNYPFRPEDRGFDEVLVHGGGGVTQTPDYWNNDYFDDTYLHNGRSKKYRGYCTDVWFGEAARFITKNKAKPFLAYIALNAPHSPYHVAPKYSQPYADNPEIPNPDFYGMITNADEQMGLFIAKLKKAGLYENTIFVFMTDNGTAAGVDFDKAGNLTKGFNAGMRGKKGAQYEGGHRVPMFLSWPAKGLAARDVEGLAGAADLLPTLLDLCGLESDEKISFDGMSLASTILQKKPIDPKRILIADTQRGGVLVEVKQSAVMQGSWRLIDGRELYDLRKDPGQKSDVALANPALVAQLKTAYRAWWKEVSQGADAFNRVIVGHERQPTVCLTSHDFYTLDENPAWNQEQIRLARGGSGPWEIAVARPGRYRISLRRYPLESGLALDAVAPVPAAPPGVDPYPLGKSLTIRKAVIEAGPLKAEQAVLTGAQSSDFVLELPAGPSRLQAWLVNESGDKVGAFYAYISKVE